MLSKYPLWLHYIIFSLLMTSIIISKIVENEWFTYFLMFFGFFWLTERSVEKVISKDFKKLILFYVVVGVVGVVLVYFFSWIGLLVITAIMIAIALKITWEYHREEREKEEIKQAKEHKKKEKQREEFLKQRKKELDKKYAK